MRKGTNTAYQWLAQLPTWLFPPTCLLCGAPGMDERDLCAGCYADLPFNRFACRCCALPLQDSQADLLCGECQRQKPVFRSAYAPLLYQQPIDFLIQGFKFNGRLTNARLLGDLLATALAQRDLELPECIIPIPLHARRLRERGFNQSLELARPIAQRLGVPLAPFCVKRTRPTPPQTGLDLADRRKNIRGVFAVTRTLAVRHVAIIDDVMTSGSTVNELARVLRESGIEVIDVWACARTPSH